MLQEHSNTQIFVQQTPINFSKQVLDTIKRIEHHHNTVGVAFFNKEELQMSTLPENVSKSMETKIPRFTNSLRRAVEEITASMNSVNPIVDRIMDDESVESVILTNNEGAPIFTNVNVSGATLYGMELQRFGALAQAYVQEIDPFDEVIALRINTRKISILVAPHKEFNIIVVQHARIKKKTKKNE